MGSPLRELLLFHFTTPFCAALVNLAILYVIFFNQIVAVLFLCFFLSFSSVQLDGIRVKKKDSALISMDQVLLI